MSTVDVKSKYLIGMVVAGLTNRHNKLRSKCGKKTLPLAKKRNIYYMIVIDYKIIICSSFNSNIQSVIRITPNDTLYYVLVKFPHWIM